MGGILYKGFVIGILVSAPMGPIGLLCIQRTLNKGRWHGFFSGLGAVGSDIFYALLTCLGMGIVIDFIQSNQEVLQVAGGILMMLFGIYIYRSNPSKNLHRPPTAPKNYFQDTVTAFGLTLSNPFIIFLFIALFARFNFLAEATIFSTLIGIASIAAGAIFWWFLITFLVNKVRNNFNVRGLWIMNRIVGTVIVVIAAVGTIVALWEYAKIMRYVR
ncbi:MAG: LysE family transporter [Dysgonamonadaceae bacterium]|jgi:threonine/homoserine/homoserine lactone efflux protein|nr:LysE family transporter [Dysgonamonadaceae bacterium]